MDQFMWVYESMLGLLEADAQMPGVENAFADGMVCTRAYEEMRSAYERLCRRLAQTDEDPDLNQIVESMEIIQKELCRRMYAWNRDK